jgi:hypothetical protein
MSIDPSSPLLHAIVRGAGRTVAAPPPRLDAGPNAVKRPNPAAGSARAEARPHRIAELPDKPNPDLPRGSLVDITA